MIKRIIIELSTRITIANEKSCLRRLRSQVALVKSVALRKHPYIVLASPIVVKQQFQNLQGGHAC
jgi:hypothetical protein